MTIALLLILFSVALIAMTLKLKGGASDDEEG